MNKRIPALTLAFALAACSSVNTAYFTLPDSQFELPAGQGNEVALQVILAEPLATGGLVYQTDPLHLNFAKQNLWAAPLDQSIAANLANKLNRQSKRYRFIPAGRSQASTTLKIYIENFNGTYQGHTLIQGYSQWPDGSGRNFRIETPQQGDGYPAMVQSLDQGLTQAAERLAY